MESFHKNKNSIDGYAYRCIECHKVANLNYNKKPEAQERRRIRDRNYRSRPEIREHQRETRLFNYKSNESRRKASKEQNLKNKYGLTLVNFENMKKEQNGVCFICKKIETAYDPRSKKIRDLAVDHNHVTKQVRKLLCYKCNTGIGQFMDSPELLILAAEYLKMFDK